MRVLLCGGRDYLNTKKVVEVLEQLLNEGYSSVVTGGCPTGADRRVDEEAKKLDFGQVYIEPAKWNVFPNRKAAGPIRNTAMLHIYEPDLVVAFSGGSGTANMVRQAKFAGIPVRLIE